jgi:hypothetical protein
MHHYAFHVSDAAFDAVFGRIKEAGRRRRKMTNRQHYYKKLAACASQGYDLVRSILPNPV